jgi:hypothetical protein
MNYKIIISIILIILISAFNNLSELYYMYYPAPHRYNFKNEYNNISLKNVINKYNNTSKKSYNIKNNVVFFYSISYKTIPDYYTKASEALSHYCKIHNYTLFKFNHYDDEIKISPFWIRVFDFINLSKKYDSNTIFVYLDIDTFVNPKYFNFNINNIIDTIDNIENKFYDVYIGNDPAYTSNAGIIIIRNTLWSKKFLNHWLSKYNENDWQLVNNKWKCQKDKRSCRWGEKGYEQGEFNIIYDKNEIDSRNHIKVLHYSIISNNKLEVDSFIYHFYSKDKKKCINNIYKKYLSYI